MSATEETSRLDPSRYSAAQLRTVDAAFDLFADHGVSGTSLQMIADALGITKAAVYHQFNTKDSIVLAVAEVGLTPLQAALEEAERETDPGRGRELLLERVVDLAVERRQWASALQGDPAIVRLLAEHEPFADLLARVYGLLLGQPDSPNAAVRAAIVASAVGGAVANPMLAFTDDEVLRAELLAICRRLFEPLD